MSWNTKRVAIVGFCAATLAALIGVAPALVSYFWPKPPPPELPVCVVLDGPEEPATVTADVSVTAAPPASEAVELVEHIESSVVVDDAATGSTTVDHDEPLCDAILGEYNDIECARYAYLDTNCAVPDRFFISPPFQLSFDQAVMLYCYELERTGKIGRG
jgi:hypothetical protein